MFRSLRTNLFAAFLGLMALFLLLVLAINAFFLDDIFIYGTQQTMARTADTLAAAVAEGTFTEDAVAEAAIGSGLFISVFNEDGTPAFNGGILRVRTDSPGDGRPPAGLPPDSGRDRAPDRQDLSHEAQVLLNRFKDGLDQGRQIYTEAQDGPKRGIFLLERLDNGQILMLMKPMVPLRESSSLATVFVLVSGSVVMLAGAVAIFLFSGRVTAPILAMDRVARKMADLDFSETITVTNRDEVGTLGASIQRMSESLHGALTELQSANSRLQLEIERERELDQQRRRFISSVSHELRTPLSMIQGYADGLRHGVVESPEGMAEYCDVIVDETRKMSGLIRDMLDLSSYEAGAFTVRPAAFDLAPLVRQAAQRAGGPAENGSGRVSVTGPQSCPAYGDSGRIGQILTNFLNNALNHGHSEAPVAVRFGAGAGETWLEVFNQGPPIPEAELARIWDPFYKAGRGAVSREGGVGLGLAIAQAIAEAHRGRCTAENREGGVAFRFAWPAVHGAEAENR